MRTLDDIAEAATELADKVASMGGDGPAPTAYELRDAIEELTKLVRSMAQIASKPAPKAPRRKR